MGGLSESGHAKYVSVGFVQILNREIVRKHVPRASAPKNGKQSRIRKPIARIKIIIAAVLYEKKWRNRQSKMRP